MTGYPPKDIFSIAIGDNVATWHTVSEKEIVAFAEVTGDRNPIHLDAVYAAQTPFKERIAHGMLTASYFASIFGTSLPGPGAIYVSQTLHFKAPVKINDTVLAKVTVTGKDEERRRVSFECICKVGEKIVLTGEAVLQLPA